MHVKTKAVGCAVTMLLVAAAFAAEDPDPCVPDELSPVGGIVAPQDGACFGAGTDRLFVQDDFNDACDPELDRTYAPPPNPATKVKAVPAKREQQVGHHVATDEHTILVASRREQFTNEPDLVHVFERQGHDWVEVQQLQVSDGMRDDRFGESLDVDGDWLVVGAPFTDDLGTSSGAVYVFRRSGGTWTEHAKLLAPDGSGQSYFGYDVGIDDGTIVVGSENVLVSPTTGATYASASDRSDPGGGNRCRIVQQPCC
jgi:hypothetical protein